MVEEYVVFDDAAGELKMSEAELKGLMDEGKIRHFMDSGNVKFRRKDLDELKVSLGIIEAPEEITLAPPDEIPEVPAEEMPEVPPPPPADLGEEIAIEPLEEVDAAAAAGAVMPGGAGAAGEEEELASLSEFEIGADVEEEGEEISAEEAELLSVGTPGFRTYEEPESANIGMTVALVITAILIFFGAITLFSFIGGTNPLTSLTGLFVK